jgi:hypothetical protein
VAALDLELFALACGSCKHLDPKSIDNITGRLVSYCHKRKTWEGWDTPRGEPGDFWCKHHAHE